MSGFRVEGNTSGNVAEVNASNELKVALSNTPANIGGVRMFSENDDGTVTGTAYLKSPETSTDYRIRVAEDTLLFQDTFNYAAQNTGVWCYRTSTLTTTWGSGFATLNGAGVVTAGQTSLVTWKTFPIYGGGGFYHETMLLLTALPPANWQLDFGASAFATTPPFAPTDGAFWRINSTGIFGVASYAGVETVSGLLLAAADIGINTARKFTLVVTEDELEFWLDDQKLGSLATATGNGQPFSAGAVPCGYRLTQPIAAGAVCQAKIADITISQADYAMGRKWAHQMCAMGQHAYQGQSGGTMGSSANYANSANPTAAVPTNTTAALGSGFGGQFWETDTLAVTTDGIIQSFQNLAGTTAITPRDLMVTGVKIESFVQTALTGGGYVASWSLAFGHTAVSIATAEAATTKAARRIPLGLQTVASGAVALTQLATINVDLSEDPIVVHAGEFIATVKKKIGTAPSAGVIGHVITLRGHYV